MPMPAKKDSEKRKLIGARFDPPDRERIEEFARESGISPGSEVEKRVKATLGFDDEGLRLIAEWGEEIQLIQRGLGGSKPWHKDLKKWSAVTDMLRTGPIMRRNPDRPEEDEAVADAFARLNELEAERSAIIQEAREVGIAWTDNPQGRKLLPKRAEVRNLFRGKNVAPRPNALSPFNFTPRDSERRLLKDLPEGSAKASLIDMHARLEVLDEEIIEARNAWTSLLSDYWDKEDEGRKWNRARQMANAKEAFDAGEPYDFYQLTGGDPWNLKG